MAKRITTRQRVLAILSRERDVYNRKTREYERVPVTMAEAAKKVGVSVRTLRRWKNEGVEPSKPSAARKLAKEAQKSASVTAKELAADRRRHPKTVRISKKDLPVLPVGHRRNLKRYVRGKSGRVRPTGESYESPWINYNVRGWTFREIAALVIQVWKAKHAFQFIYEVPAGGSLPKSGDKPPRRVRRTTRAATAPVNPYAFDTQAEVLEFLNQYVEFDQGKLSRRMLYIAIDDNKPQRSRNDDDNDEE